jgi:hypothetical protein
VLPPRFLARARSGDRGGRGAAVACTSGGAGAGEDTDAAHVIAVGDVAVDTVVVAAVAVGVAVGAVAVGAVAVDTEAAGCDAATTGAGSDNGGTPETRVAAAMGWE